MALISSSFTGIMPTAYAAANVPQYQTAERQMEKLNRGLIAVKTTKDSRGQTVDGVYLSWRLLGTESLENQAFLRIEEKAARKFKMTKTMLTDKEHCYKKCSHCKAYLRLPKRSGTHTAVCPKCGEKLTVRIR